MGQRKLPYLLYITKQDVNELQRFIRTNHLDIITFLCVPKSKRKLIQEILETEIKAGQTEPDNSTHIKPNESKPKTFLVNDVLFEEISVVQDIVRLRARLSNQDDQLNKVNPEGCVPDNQFETSEELGNVKRNDSIKLQRASAHGENIDCDVLTDNKDFNCCRREGTVNDDDSHMPDRSIKQDVQRNSSNTILKEEFKDSDKNDISCKTELENDESCHESVHEYSDNDDKYKERESVKDISNTRSLSKKVQSQSRKYNHRRGDGKIKCFSERWSKLKCNICGKCFATDHNFNRHKRMMHPTGEPMVKIKNRQKKQETETIHVCSICKKQFSDKYCLQAYEKNIHTDQSPAYQCDLCGAVLKFKGSLKQHMKAVHTDKRPHRCKICGKHFKIVAHLKCHERLHDPDYVETCTLCGKTIRRGQISVHMKRHNHKGRYTCSTCGKRFFEKQDLTRHSRIHSGDKPFHCTYCPYACALKGNLNKHILHKHKNGVGDFETFLHPKKCYKIKRKEIDAFQQKPRNCSLNQAAVTRSLLKSNEIQKSVDKDIQSEYYHPIAENLRYEQPVNKVPGSKMVSILNPALNLNIPVPNSQDAIGQPFATSDEFTRSLQKSINDHDNITTVYIIDNNITDQHVSPTVTYSKIAENYDNNMHIHHDQNIVTSGILVDDSIRSGHNKDDVFYHNLRPVGQLQDGENLTINTNSEVPIMIAMQSNDGQNLQQETTSYISM